MASLAAIRQGLADALNALDGVHAYPKMPGSINPPGGGVAAVVQPESADWHAAMGGVVDRAFTVTLFANKADNDAGQDILDAYLDPDDPLWIKTAIEADETLGGIVDYVTATGWDNYGMATWSDGVQYWSAQVHVEVG